MNLSELSVGLYEQVVTEGIEERLGAIAPDIEFLTQDLDPGDSHEYLAQHGFSTLRQILQLVDSADPERVRKQAEILNSVLALAGELATDSAGSEVLLTNPTRMLMEVHATALGTPRPPRPVVPLIASALLVNEDESLSAATALKRELASADHVDLICAFVNFTGVRILEAEIQRLCRRGVLRVITTTYMGATQRRALDALQDWGAQIKVTYEVPPASTKLHAKAWLFRRHSGFDTAMVGSSNLSHTALMDGLEWNVRLSRVDAGQVLDKFQSTFERYWQDTTFESYDQIKDGVRLDQALRTSGGRDASAQPTLFLDVIPKPHQTEILEALDADRARGHRQSLVVSATGTGKTFLSALDYKRLCSGGSRPTLLFVAHRAEILKQSRTAFGHVLRDFSFGELMVGGEIPREGRHLFASVQSLHEHALQRIAPDRFDHIIVDEFHHAEAATYQRLLRHFKPNLLLGLTATPERADGRNVVDYFGGRTAYEMRLWDALQDELLCPFQYFGIAVDEDLSRIEWKGGRYDAKELENLLVLAGEQRAALVLEQTRKIVFDVAQMRALGFCVSIRHDTFMAERFNSWGVPCAAITSETTQMERESAIKRLRSGELNALFTVDLFNEGVDIPELDTILFLRPTESATVFLQQLGRGLRRCENKPCTTVLDFVGRQHSRFRFDLRFRALTGQSRRALEHGVEHGFASLPPGCHIQLDRTSADHVLANLREALPSKTHELVAELRALAGKQADYPLKDFVRETGVDVEDIYRPQRYFTSLKRLAGLLTSSATAEETQMARGLQRLLHVDDYDRASYLSSILTLQSAPRLDSLGARERRNVSMLVYSLAGDAKQHNMQQAVDTLWSNSSLRMEAAELLSILGSRYGSLARPLGVPGLDDVPLCTHATYSQDEVMVAFDMPDPSAMRQGVKYFQEKRCDVLFVTLRKTEREYSPTTRYKDYPISETEFHWESQNSTSGASETGKRYTRHMELGSTVLLFVRESRASGGLTSPYFSLGPVEYVRHNSERPMQIVWRLIHPLPHSRFLSLRTAAG